tara:strand:- start:19 stop:792 length:774 start_codon:yes stop_codon:yes gene_type:complete
MSESNRHTLTVTESNVQLTLLSGPVGAAGAAGPNTITSATSSDSTGNISLSNLNTATLTTTGTATIGGAATLSAAATIAGAATLSGGVAITGDTTIASGSLSIGNTGAGNIGRILIGDGASGNGNLQIFHNGTDSYIDDIGTGDLNIRGSARVNLQKYSGETFVSCLEDSSVTLYYDNVVKIETTASGVNVSGVIQHSVYTVATLASSIGPSFLAAGMRAFVSDSTSSLSSHHGQTVVGGGANFVPVFYDGTNWIVG